MITTTTAAEKLGITPQHLNRKLKQMGIQPERQGRLFVITSEQYELVIQAVESRRKELIGEEPAVQGEIVDVDSTIGEIMQWRPQQHDSVADRISESALDLAEQSDALLALIEAQRRKQQADEAARLNELVERSAEQGRNLARLLHAAKTQAMSDEAARLEGNAV